MEAEFVRFQDKLTGMNVGASFIVPLKTVTDGGLWRLWPVINCDKVMDAPKDYPGLIGLPITSLDKNFRGNGWELVGKLRHGITENDGKEKYVRFLYRNTKPDLPEYIDIASMLRQCGRALVLATTPLQAVEKEEKPA